MPIQAFERTCDNSQQRQQVAMGSPDKVKKVKKEKKEKKDKKAKKEAEETVAAEAEVEAPAAEPAAEAPGKLSLCAIAMPLADDKLSKKCLKLAKKAAKRKQIKRGVKEVIKAIRKNVQGLCLIAGDISPVDVITPLPVMCEDRDIPYIYVPSKEALGQAGLTKRPTSCMLILPKPLKGDAAKDDETKEFAALYAEVAKKVKAAAIIFTALQQQLAPRQGQAAAGQHTVGQHTTQALRPDLQATARCAPAAGGGAQLSPAVISSSVTSRLRSCSAAAAGPSPTAPPLALQEGHQTVTHGAGPIQSALPSHVMFRQALRSLGRRAHFAARQAPYGSLAALMTGHNAASAVVLGLAATVGTTVSFAASANSERSFIMVKPDGVHRGLVGDVIKRFEQRGYKLVGIKVLVPSRELASKHYAEHDGKPFFPKLVDFLSSGAVVACVFEGKDVVKTGRTMIGATNPLASAPGTLRADFAVDMGRNIIHGSDSVESAMREIALWFNADELATYATATQAWGSIAMFAFGGASTPAFGGGASATGATPAFGAAPASSTPSLFGAASSAAFGQTAPAFAATSPFGGGVSTPLFGAASSASLFGAASTPSLFGAGGGTAAPAFGFQSSAAGAAPSLFGVAQPGALMAAQQQVTALATKDNRPISHSTKWEELSPQTQQYLAELEKVVLQYRADCRQLDADPRLASTSGASAQQQAMQAQARSLSQSISALGTAVRVDVEEAAVLREAVLRLVRSAESALHTFKRAHAWREASKAATPVASQDLAGPPVLPSHFLRESIASFLDRLKQHQVAVTELEQVLLASGGAGSLVRHGNGDGRHPGDGLAALHAALTNVHDFLIHTAARLQLLDDRVSAARDAYLARRRAAGDTCDPFAEEERRQQHRNKGQPRGPAAQAAALHAAQQPYAGQQLGAGHAVIAAGGTPPTQALAVASPGGLFGTMQSPPGAAFGTPLFGQQQQQQQQPSRKQSSRRRMDFLVGTALIVLPAQHQVPLALATAAVKGLQGLRHRRKLRRAASSSGGMLEGGGLSEVQLEWRDLTCTLAGKKGGSSRLLLNQVSGCAAAGRLTAIMGPSGSGKTTLLAALANQMPFSPRVTLRGHIAANGVPLQASKVRSGYVQQDDLFYPQLTVRETLLMAAELRMRGQGGEEERRAHVEEVIARLGLAQAADTRVGDAKTRGLSGGEKKRLSIAMELISRPAVLLCDEPTSGLDAFSAEKVMGVLKELCSDGHTVLASIHQPRSSVFALFDDLILLADGEVVYSGPASAALPHFEALGHSCPTHYNPAEWLSDLVAVDYSSPETEAATKERLRGLVAAWRNDGAAVPGAEAVSAAPDSAAAEAVLAPPSRPRCGLGRQVALLFKRSLRQVLRDKATNIGRASSQVSSAAVFAAIYWRMRRSQSSIQDRMGLLQVSAVGTAMSSLIKTLNVFTREKTLVGRERARSGYGVLPYLLSKLAAELPLGAAFPALFACLVYPATGLNPRPARFASFLALLTLEAMSAQGLGLAVGAAAPTTEAALAIGPAVILVSIVFGGLFVNARNVPGPLKWLPHTSLIKQAFEGACVNEFKGARFELDERGQGTASGDEVLQRLSFGGSSVGGALANQGRIMVFYWWLTYNILVRRQARYQPLLPPANEES
ncbi:ABC transporter G family member 7 [Chlorella vulgaris]